MTLKPPLSFTVGARVVEVEHVDDGRYLVTIDGRRFASFCSASRARSAGRSEARRLGLFARETSKSQR